MDPKEEKNQSATTITMLIVALFIGLVGWYTDNSGFIYAGVILLIVGLVVGLNQSREKGS